MTDAIIHEIVCTACAKRQKCKPTKTGNLRIPRGWHRLNAEIVCQECWDSRYKLRAITFPLAGPIDGEWADLRKALTESWGRSTALANWAVSQLFTTDVPRSSSDEKMKPHPPIYLFGLWKEHHQRSEWNGAASSAQSLMRTVEAKYSKLRRKIVWLGEVSVPSFRYPYPYPVHNQAWTASYQQYEGTDGHISRVPVVSVQLGGQRWTLRLAGGAERIRQLRAFAKIVSGEAVSGELAIYRQGTFAGNNGVVESKGAAGSKRKTRVMVKLVAWLPRDPAEPDRTGTLNVRTTNNSFLIALADGDTEPWRLHADDVRGVIKQHAKLRQRLADDTKAEQRRPPRQKARYLAMLEQRCQRCNNRIDSFIKEAASWLVNYAKRRRVAALTLDDAVRGYFPSFPWAAFRAQVAQKCEDAAIVFVDANDEATENEGEENPPEDEIT